VTAGASVTFTVTAQGRPAPSFQWRFNGSAINGASSASLNLTNLQIADAGNYTVTVTNNAGSVTSNAASLTVNTSAFSGGGSSDGGGGGGGGGAMGGWFVMALALLGCARRKPRG
jgi:PKD repeat protein